MDHKVKLSVQYGLYADKHSSTDKEEADLLTIAVEEVSRGLDDLKAPPCTQKAHTVAWVRYNQCTKATKEHPGGDHGSTAEPNDELDEGGVVVRADDKVSEEFCPCGGQVM